MQQFYKELFADLESWNNIEHINLHKCVLIWEENTKQIPILIILVVLIKLSPLCQNTRL